MVDNWNFNSGRAYYGPSLTPTNPDQSIWSSRPPEPFYPSSAGSVLAAGSLAAGAFASGFIPFRGTRLWDRYVGGIRAAEEYSPGSILRTFQFSTFFSQFTSQAHQGFSLTGPQLRQHTAYAGYLSKLIGEQYGSEVTLQKLFQEGVSLSGGRLTFGGGQVALPYASALFTPETTEKIELGLTKGQRRILKAGKHYGAAYARSIGAEAGSSGAFGLVEGELTDQAFHRQIIGGKTRAEHLGRLASGWGGEFVDRFNRLLKAPVELPGLRTIFAASGLKLHVAEGSGLQMLGRLSAKYGLALGAAGLGYQTLDYLAKGSSLTQGTLFEEGLTVGLGTLLVKGQLATSKVADITGLHDYREKQEEIAPGSTELSKLLAFPLMGAVGAATAGYLTRVYKMGQLQRTGMSASVARMKVAGDMQRFSRSTILGRAGKALTESTSHLYRRRDWVGSAMRAIAKPTSEGKLSYRVIGELGPIKLAGLAGAAAGFALIAPFLPGALTPSTRPEELENIYSGAQEVPIRKGRWWEFGRSPFEGNRIMYYRPHWYARMRADAMTKSLGEENMSPLERWWRREFTYDLEKEKYRERPYPVTSLPFEDVPLIGPVLAHTIGRLIKPPKLMHTEEWMQDGSMKSSALGFDQRIATELGEQAPPQAVNPYGAGGLIGEQAYRLTEMMGLPGFAMTSIKEGLTGSPDLFDQMAQLESSRRMFGMERRYWDLEIGGGLGTTEVLRRLYPHRRRQIPLYNPIRNLMPEWLPGPGEKSPDFLHGDPYTKVQEGELRLPGAGYAARFPELEGIAPEDYPTIHKFKILADVAPYSDKFKQILGEVGAARKRDSWTEEQEIIYQNTLQQLDARKDKLIVRDYKYLTPMGDIFGKPSRWGEDTGSELVAELNRQYAQQQEAEKPSIFSRLFGSYWELLSHNAETAVDQLTPISPGSKLVHERTPIESYERLQVYGTENAFWQHPFRDFLRPATQLAARSFGWSGVPGHIEDRRELEEYFDVLEYVKFSRLSNLARTSGDIEAFKDFESKKDETLFGINPYTFNYRSIFRALPRRDRDYFNAFAEAETEEERKKILELVPDNEKALYVARWKLAFGEEVKKAQKAGILSGKQIEEAELELASIKKEIASEGFPQDEELYAEYWATRTQGETYGDWYRRTRLLLEVPLPGPDWVGWHPSVDLEDIKLKVINETGEDMHEYDIWPSQAQGLINRPYIDEGAVQPIMNPDTLDRSGMEERINSLLMVNQMRPSTFFRTAWGPEDTMDVHIEQDADMESALNELRNGR